MGPVSGHIVAIDEFCHSARVDDGMKGNETRSMLKDVGVRMQDIPSRPFGNIDAEECLPSLAKFCTLGNEAKSIKVHVCATDDDHKLFLCADEVVLQDITFEGSEGEGTGWLRDRPRF